MKTLALLLLALPALAQFEITADLPEGQKAVASVFDIGATNVGEPRDVWLIARNAGAAPGSIQVLSVAGMGFSILNHPALPAAVEPGGAIRFRVQFNPPSAGSFSATLRVNQTTMILRGAAGVVAALIVDQQGILSAGQTIDFGRVVRGTPVTKKLRIESIAGTTVTVSALTVLGAAFRLRGEPPLPLTLAPRESVEFELEFQTAAAGAEEGRLTLDNRTFLLRGLVVEPQLPPAALVLSSEAPSSGRQMRLSVKLAAVSRTTGKGVVRMSFRPGQGLGEDPAAGFVQFPGRAAPFTIAEGDQSARFGDSTEAIFQTGTTAGVIVFTLELGESRGESSLTIPPAPPRIESPLAARRPAAIELTLSGFDNTRSLSALSFSFYDQSGNVMGTAIRVDAAEAFRRHFSGDAAGGLFSLRAVFPVTGDSSAVHGVEVELSNSSGATRTGRIRIE